MEHKNTFSTFYLWPITILPAWEMNIHYRILYPSIAQAFDSFYTQTLR